MESNGINEVNLSVALINALIGPSKEFPFKSKTDMAKSLGWSISMLCNKLSRNNWNIYDLLEISKAIEEKLNEGKKYRNIRIRLLISFRYTNIDKMKYCLFKEAINRDNDSNAGKQLSQNINELFLKEINCSKKTLAKHLGWSLSRLSNKFSRGNWTVHDLIILSSIFRKYEFNICFFTYRSDAHYYKGYQRKYTILKF